MDAMEEIAKCRDTESKHLAFAIDTNESIPDELCELTWLKSLQLVLISQAHLPKEIGKLTRLEELYINGGEFDSLPESICNLSALKILEIECSLLRKLPENIGQLKNLTHVSFYGTQLENLPESIGQLQNLKKLQLHCCQLVSLPASMGNLSNLQIIQLTNNHLTALPEEFANLKQLKELYLAQNELIEVPACIEKLKTLTSVVLNNNKLTSIPSWLDKNICNLREEHLIKPLPIAMKRSYHSDSFERYEHLLDIFPILHKGQEKHPNLDKKALQVYDLYVHNQNILSPDQRKIVEKFLKYFLMPEDEEISYIIEKYSFLDRRLSIEEGAELLQELLFEKPIKITADEKETIVSFFEVAGHWEYFGRPLSDFIHRYRSKEVAPFSYWSPFNPSILCFDISRSFGIHPHIIQCPVCTSDISVVKRKFHTVEGQQFKEEASMPYVITKLHVCPVCQWWAVSEILQDCETNGMGEAVFTCGGQPDEAVSTATIRRQIKEMYNNTSHPWSPVFREQQYWGKIETMTWGEALWLYGEEQCNR